MDLRKLLAFFLLGTFSLFADLSEGMRKTLLSDLESMRSVFAVQYAPKEWKAEFKNWDLDREIDLAKKEITRMHPLTIKGYQRVVRNFFQSPADYHVVVEFFSTEQALLPFLVRGAEGRYFIVEINRNLLPHAVFPVEEGDELLFFDGKPVDLAIKELKNSDFSQNNPDTDQALAEQALTLREGSAGLIVPKGKLPIVVKRRNGEVRNLSLDWIYIPELINEPGSRDINRFYGSKNVTKQAPIRKFLDKQMVYTKFSQSSKLPCTLEASYRIGARKSYIPLLGTPLWQSSADDSFYAYIFMQSGKRIGYVRIPHYMGDELEVEEFRKIIKRLEGKTDALVIDQVNNPGGSIFYLYALASLLTDRPLKTPKHCMALTQEEVMIATSLYIALSDVEETASAQEVLGKTVGGYPVTYEFAKKTQECAELVITEWELGHLITKPTFLLGVDDIQPYPYERYTKPILFLINSLDFSGGDFLPLIMKENRRATILGTRTAGAGGYVVETSFFNLGSIKKFTLTGSFAKTQESLPLENLGVSPDIFVDLTANDLQNNCVDLKRAILRAVDALPKGK